MKTWIYAKRNMLELLSDPISLVFLIGLPAFLLLFMVSLNQNLPINDSFQIDQFLPATIVFSFSFLTMFSGMLVAKDRSSSFLNRMYISPLKAHHYIIGYLLPIWLIGWIQCILLTGIGLFLGLSLSIHLISGFLVLMFVSILFIALGLALGSLLKDQQVGPIASILVQVVAFLSGMWFSLDLIGGAFQTIGYLLPFAHAVDLTRHVMQGNYQDLGVAFLVVTLYILIIGFFAIIQFKKTMKS